MTKNFNFMNVNGLIFDVLTTIVRNILYISIYLLFNAIKI